MARAGDCRRRELTGVDEYLRERVVSCQAMQNAGAEQVGT
jgi:hypothetical protein